jgi:hypothetical protein
LYISKSGKVKAPYNYREWYAEIVGNTNDTGGFHLMFWKKKEQSKSIEGYNYLHFWGITKEDVYEQLKALYIEVEWDDSE